MLDIFDDSSLDYFANNIPPATRKFPDGVDVEIFTFQALERAYKEAKNVLEREHVTFYLWNPKNGFKTDQYKSRNDYSDYRLTIDYEADLKVGRFLASELNKQAKFGYVQELIKILDNNPSIKKLNEKHFFGEGWEIDKKKANKKQ